MMTMTGRWLLVAILPLALGAAPEGSNQTRFVEHDVAVDVTEGVDMGRTGASVHVHGIYGDSDEMHNGRYTESEVSSEIAILGEEEPGPGVRSSSNTRCDSEEACEAVDSIVGHESREPKNPPGEDRKPHDYAEEIDSLIDPSNTLTDDNCSLLPVDACGPVIETWDDVAPEFPVDLTN